MECPKIRYGLELMPIVHEGRQLFLIRDRMGYAKEPLLLSPALARLVALMDGENSVRDLQAYHMRTTGELLVLDRLKEILKQLDERLFLENDRFLEHVAQAAARFRDDPVRRMQFAGKSYPGDPEVLRRQLDGFFSPENGGPGQPLEGSAGHRRLLGLVAPHIDVQAGGPCFAHAYKAAAEAAAPETWVILGTGHEPLDNYFALTQKDFETPLGLMACDRDFCRALIDGTAHDILASEYNHHREHTIEFQAVFLAHLSPRARIVPMLCSFSLEDWQSDRGSIQDTIASIREVVRQSPSPVGIVASVDLAHVGPRYGAASSPGKDAIARHRAADLELLKPLEQCDGGRFMDTLYRECNRRQVCGMAPLYVLAEILAGRARGELLHHAHAVVDQQNSFVTFASMAFYEERPQTPASW